MNLIGKSLLRDDDSTVPKDERDSLTKDLTWLDSQVDILIGDSSVVVLSRIVIM